MQAYDYANAAAIQRVSELDNSLQNLGLDIFVSHSGNCYQRHCVDNCCSNLNLSQAAPEIAHQKYEAYAAPRIPELQNLGLLKNGCSPSGQAKTACGSYSQTFSGVVMRSAKYDECIQNFCDSGVLPPM